MMRSPRCSLPDQEDQDKPVANQERGNMRRRRKRALSMWTRRSINWRLVGSPQAADLQVDFLHGYHGDGYPFDGAGGAVGHAFFPSDAARAGGVHLDAEEEWAFRQPVLVHEFGHALGLAHSSSRNSVMRPYYQGPAGDPLHYRLGAQDLEHITQLYGKRNQLLATDPPRLAPDPQLRHRGVPLSPFIDRCNSSFDAVARIRGETFSLKVRGPQFRRLWRGLPPDLPQLHAVLERTPQIMPSSLSVVLSSGCSEICRSRRASLSPSPPSGWGELRWSRQSEEAAAERWGLVGTQRRVLEWASQDSEGSVYLFKGDSYWKFLFPGSPVQDGYPRSSSADWLDCPDPSSSSPVLDDLSLSLSPPAGRQELRERWKGETEKEKEGGRRRTHERDRQDRGLPVLTQCSCQNGALCGSTSSCLAALLLITWTLMAL
ncbi:hypothetical protein F7725_009507 [Dissostichus mawsoni]|uniref:Peptidase metallopeptidase domain-containing protein n=1 Tax=Dissostichus mawsoni TaxID=36200 RepID=A0A7J5XMF3_DISMA|nr:hypothetical protein F7725_009507 [Dissostichus mawsoni]